MGGRASPAACGAGRTALPKGADAWARGSGAGWALGGHAGSRPGAGRRGLSRSGADGSAWGAPKARAVISVAAPIAQFAAGSWPAGLEEARGLRSRSPAPG